MSPKPVLKLPTVITAAISVQNTDFKRTNVFLLCTSELEYVFEENSHEHTSIVSKQASKSELEGRN